MGQAERLLSGAVPARLVERFGSEAEAWVTPDVSIAAQEAAALRAWASCRHVVALVDSDLERGALLLESVRPGGQLSDDPGGWSLDDVAPMLAELWQRYPIAGEGLPDLRERVDVVFDLARSRVRRWPAVHDRIGRDVMDRSHAACRILAQHGPVGLVHGDLHPGNVLRGAPDRGVVAIDPRPCWGDPAFDTVDWMLSDVTDDSALHRRIDWLASTVPEVDPARLWAWCQSMAVIIAASVLGRHDRDPVGEYLLRLARTVG